MPVTKKTRRKLDYLVRATGQAEDDIVAQAVEDGLSELYRKQLAQAYLSGNLDREKAVRELGKDAVAELDCAHVSVDAGIEFGLKAPIGRRISRAEALQIARDTIERAERERLELAEWEAQRGIQYED